jgi:hypothetical protein
MSTYILLPHAVTTLPTQVGPSSLALYQTAGDPHLGLFANVLGLYGFWRLGPGPVLPKDVVTGWPFLLLAILLLVALGAWSALRHVPAADGTTRTDISGETTGGPRVSDHHENGVDRDTAGANHRAKSDQRRLAMVLLFVGVAGYFLALGNQGPTGGLFLWAYDHVPFFAVMREPQKFLMLVAMAYAILFGWGVERLSRVTVSPLRAGAVAAAAILGVAVPLSYTPTIFDGLAGQIAPSTLPASYQRANSLMGSGPGNILYLPWQLYMEYPFTNGRVVANVAPSSFTRNVISGDNVESGGGATQSTSPRSAYLTQLFADGPSVANFGALVAPLGVKYVVLAKTVNFSSYSWLNDQRDLKLVLNSASLEVWRQIFEVNVFGTWAMSVAAMEALRATKGSIVNVSSIAGIRQTGSSIPYATSKAALNHLTTLLAKVVGPEVRVNAVAPGLVDTEWTAQWDAVRHHVQTVAPLRRSATPEDVAAAIESLVDNVYVTGQILAVDGGLSLMQ